VTLRAGSGIRYPEACDSHSQVTHIETSQFTISFSLCGCIVAHMHFLTVLSMPQIDYRVSSKVADFSH